MIYNSKRLSLLVAFILLATTATFAAYSATEGDLEADVNDNISELGLLALLWSIQIQGNIIEDVVADQVFIEERDDATDGPPGDSVYDVQDPGTPPGTTWLNMWLDDNLPSPKDVLQNDARFGPDTYKVFNLTCVYSNYSFPAGNTLQFSWNNLAFQGTEYTYANLTDGSFTVLADMMTSSVYTQTSTVLAPQAFHIVLTKVETGDCEYQICVDDSYGDTWNGGLLDVYVNAGLVYNDLNASDGLSGTWECYPLTVSTGDVILMDYTYGSYPGENDWKLINANGFDTYFMTGGYSDTTYDGTEIVDCDETTPSVPEGGDCTNPIVVDIPADLTYTDLGQTNCGLGDSYSDTELGSYDGGEDIIYELVVSTESSFTVTVESLDTWVGVGLFDDCPDIGSIVDGGNAYDTGWTGPWTFNVEGLSAGTYYLMIDTFPSPNCISDFDLTIETYIPPTPQPGDDCTDPIIVNIPADLDYVNNSYTCGRGNDYSDTDLGLYDGGEDIIYRLDITADTKVNIELDAMGTTYTGVGLFEDCPDVTGTAVDFSTESGSSVHGIYDIMLYVVDSPYYIMIDTWPAPDCIPDFELTITEVIPTADVGIAGITSPPVGGGNLLLEDFESLSLPTGWQTVDYDGDSYDWFFDYTFKSNYDGSKKLKDDYKPAHTGVGQAASQSYVNYVGAVTPDNWLISPQVSIPASGDIELSYWVTGQDPDWSEEHIEVWISTTGDTVPTDFTDQVDDYTCDSGTDAWQERNVDLSSYAGEDIYIAFRHCDVSDMFILKLDDVSVSYTNPPPEYDEGVMVPMQCIVENYGETTETFDVHAVVEDGLKVAVYDEVITVSSLAPGLTYDTTTEFPDFDTTGHPGELTAIFYTDLLSDSNPGNDEKSGTFFVNTVIPPPEDGAPLVHLNSPRGGESFSGTVTISYYAIDDDNPGETLPIYIYYSADAGDTWREIDDLPLPNTGSYNWNTNGFSDGEYRILVEAVDDRLKIGWESSGIFTINNGNMGAMISDIKIQDTTIDSTTYVKDGDDIEISVGITGAIDLSRDDITADLSAFGMGTVVAHSFDGFTAKWTLNNVVCEPNDGPLTITVNAGVYDSNKGTIYADNKKPEMEVIKPENGLYFFNSRLLPIERTIIIGPFTIIVEGMDDNGLSKTEFYIDNALMHIDTNKDPEWYMNIKQTGQHQLEIRVYDLAGNKITETQMISVFNFFGA